jgi:hypothetical protein
VKGIQVRSNEGPGPLQRGDNHKKVKIGWGHLKIFFSRSTEPILTKLGKNHPWIKEIQVSSNEGDSPSPRRDDSKRVKIHRFFCLNLLLQNLWGKFNKTWYKLSLCEGNSSLFK